jgi:hypothetical protein
MASSSVPKSKAGEDAFESLPLDTRKQVSFVNDSVIVFGKKDKPFVVTSDGVAPVHVSFRMPLSRSFGHISGHVAEGMMAPIPVTLHETLFPSVPLGHILRVGAHDDGSCWYHSMVAALNYKHALSKSDSERIALGHELRFAIGRKVTRDVWDRFTTLFPEHQRLSKATFESFKKDIMNPTVWANNAHLKLTNMVLNLSILLLNTRRQSFYCGFAGEEDLKDDVVIIVWVDKEHFEAIVQLTGAHRDMLTTRGRFSRVDNKRLIHDVFRHYKKECDIKEWW